MSEFNQELVRALANGDAEAQESIKNFPAEVRMALGIEIDKLRREESIIPMNNGFSLYEEKKISYTNDEDVANALMERNRLLREADDRRERIRQEHLEKEIKARVERARAGLTMNDRR